MEDKQRLKRDLHVKSVHAKMQAVLIVFFGLILQSLMWTIIFVKRKPQDDLSLCMKLSPLCLPKSCHFLIHFFSPLV